MIAPDFVRCSGGCLVALRLRDRPHVLLALFLVATLTVFPLVERSGIGRSVLNLLVVTGIVIALKRVHASRAGVAIIAVLGAVAVVSQMLHEAGLVARSDFVSALAQTLFYFISAGLMCSYMLSDTRATIDELFAAAAAYLLLALAWATTFWFIEHLHPGSFAVANPVLPEERTWFEFLYLSMTTLSTTGFGDVLPISSAARSAVILEQFVGVLYVALVISRLAGFGGRTRRDPA
jgi:hypothetical protein